MSGKNNNTLKSAVALVLGLLLAVAVSEGSLQLIDFPENPVAGWQSCERINPGECNSMGFRGQDIVYSDDDYVVVLLGDSEVYSAASSFDETPAHRLEYYLSQYNDKVKVFTLADMGYGQDQQYLVLKKYFESYRADLVMLMFTARNDVANNISPSAGKNHTIKPTFWLEDNELHGPTEQWMEKVGPSLKLALLWNIYSGKYKGESRNKVWEENILPPGLKLPVSDEEGGQQVLYEGTTGEVQDIDSNNQKMKLKHLLTYSDDRVEYGLNLTRKLFMKIKELAESRNGRFVLFKEERPEELQGRGTRQTEMFNGKSYTRSIEQYQDNLERLFQGFEYYRIPLNMKTYTRSKTNTHLNGQAIDKMMKELSLKLNEKGYLSK